MNPLALLFLIPFFSGLFDDDEPIRKTETRYKLNPRKFTEDQWHRVKKILKDGCEEIEDMRILSESRRIGLKYRLFEDMMYDKEILDITETDYQ